MITVFTLTAAHVGEAMQARRPPLRGNRNYRMTMRVPWPAAIALIVSGIAIVAGGVWGALLYSLPATFAGLPPVLMVLMLLYSWWRSKGAGARREAEKLLANHWWAIEPCTLEITPEALRFVRPSVEEIVRPAALVSYDELQSVFRIYCVDAEHLIDLAALRRDNTLQPLRDWLKRHLA